MRSTHAKIPHEQRPCCVKCRARMSPNWLKSKLGAVVLQWLCRPCRWSTFAIQAGQPAERRPREGWETPHCIKHRCRMYRRVAEWGCAKCEKRGKSDGYHRTLKHRSEFPLDVRPHCIRDRARMTVSRHEGPHG